MELYVVLCTFPDAGQARQAASALLEAKLVACVNLLPAVESIYRWQGRVETATEVLAMMKTTKDAFPRLRERILELHPYDVPEIIALPVNDVLSSYGDWVQAEVG